MKVRAFSPVRISYCDKDKILTPKPTEIIVYSSSAILFHPILLISEFESFNKTTDFIILTLSHVQSLVFALVHWYIPDPNLLPESYAKFDFLFIGLWLGKTFPLT